MSNTTCTHPADLRRGNDFGNTRAWWCAGCGEELYREELAYTSPLIVPLNATPGDVVEAAVARQAEQVAFTVEGVYRDGYGRTALDKPYWTAECTHSDHGHIVLNSGHQWTNQRQAEAFVEYHLTTDHS